MAGVSGSGKTTVGRRVAEHLGARFVDADDFHPQSNVDKIRRGEGLSDADRAPWLAALNAELRRRSQAGEAVVLACSALTRAHRRALLAGVPGARIVFLRADPAVVHERLAHRRGAIAGPGLLPSQLADEEPPAGGAVVDAGGPLDAVVADVLRRLG